MRWTVWSCKCLKSKSDFMKAPRLPFQVLPGFARGAWLAACALLAWTGHVAAAEICVEGSRDIARACYENDKGTVPYGHGVLGATPEWLGLTLYPANKADQPVTYAAPRHVFEDLAPRLIDLDGDGRDEVLAVQSSFEEGARLAVFELAGNKARLAAATPYIGTRFRWLAPIGAADLDADGHTEIAFIDRPHLAKTLRVWRFQDRQLEYVADLRGLTNHRIGEAFISSGIRDCGQGAEMITADARWREIIATRLSAGKLRARALGAFDPAALEDALNCR